MEVHAGSAVKASKSEVLFCAAPPSTYATPSTFDGADLSDIQLPGGMSMPIVDRFPYLGDVVARHGGDGAAVAALYAGVSSPPARSPVLQSVLSTRPSLYPSPSTAVRAGACLSLTFASSA
jgi:hypothetical protein